MRYEETAGKLADYRSEIAEIREKMAANYPLFNTIFEDTRQAAP